MTILQLNQMKALSALLRRLAWCEFELIEACNAEAEQCDDGETRALFLRRAGAAQVHLFDLDSVIRALGAPPVTYTRCVRNAMLSGNNLQRAREKLAACYARVLQRTDIGPALRQLLTDNENEHCELDGACAARAVAA
jgi:hypothetical protein